MRDYKAVWPRNLAWLPIPFLLGLTGALWFTDTRVSTPPAIVLDFAFEAFVSLFVAYVIGRSFLVRASPGLLLLGCGILPWGSAGLVSAAAGGTDINLVLAIHSACVCLSAICHLAAAGLSLRPRSHTTCGSLWLVGTYIATLTAIVLIALSRTYGSHAGSSQSGPRRDAFVAVRYGCSHGNWSEPQK